MLCLDDHTLKNVGGHNWEADSPYPDVHLHMLRDHNDCQPWIKLPTNYLLFTALANIFAFSFFQAETLYMNVGIGKHQLWAYSNIDSDQFYLLLPFGNISENSRQLLSATQLLVKHQLSCFAKYPWLNNNWHTLRSVTLSLWHVNEWKPREMENVFSKKALHLEYGSKLLLYSLHSRSRCANVDRTSGKAIIALDAQTFCCLYK